MLVPSSEGSKPFTSLWDRPEYANGPLYAEVMKKMAEMSEEDLEEFLNEFPKLTMVFSAQSHEPSKRFYYSEKGEEDNS